MAKLVSKGGAFAALLASSLLLAVLVASMGSGPVALRSGDGLGGSRHHHSDHSEDIKADPLLGIEDAMKDGNADDSMPSIPDMERKLGRKLTTNELRLLNPGLSEGENKDPDDPWGYAHPRCRGLPTCSSSTSSPAVKRRQAMLRAAMAKALSSSSSTEEEEMPPSDAVQAEAPQEQQPAAAVHASKGLSMKEQYAKIMQNVGYFAPWSRQNGWVDRIAIDNIRKANTPQALAQRQQMILAENAKFAKKFSTPHTSQYTGVHESLSDILDPKYQPWANDGPRKAYYAGF